MAVTAGDRICLVGRNGSGKSTLLRIAAGLVQPDAGQHFVQPGATIRYLPQEPDFSAFATTLAYVEAGFDADAPNRHRALYLLRELGLSGMESPASLSGGEGRRAALARTLAPAPDILLLDEPTNYLDLEGTVWLENFIARYRHTVVMISHDRDLLNRAVDTIVHLDGGKLTLYRGNYDSFDQQRRERQALQQKAKKKQDEQRAHLQAFVDRFRYTASKARQAQSRVKMLERMQPIAAMADDTMLPFSFPDPAKPAAPPIIQLEDVSVGYTPGHPVLKKLD
ncbi:MAG TPA: ATP-binding cassette domain-containing protein, partial [Stellaceae bacterium]|nr:ATP-binding cassette domain-containing protein [Stellaceae bacterium]